MRGVNFKTAEPRPESGGRRPVCRPNPTFKLAPEQSMHPASGIDKARRHIDLTWDSVRFGKRRKSFGYCKSFRKCTGAYRAVVGTLGYHAKFGLHIVNADPHRWREETRTHGGMLAEPMALKSRFSFRGIVSFISIRVPERFWKGRTAIDGRSGRAYHPHPGRAEQDTKQEARDAGQEAAHHGHGVSVRVSGFWQGVSISGSVAASGAAPISAPVVPGQNRMEIEDGVQAQSSMPSQSAVPAIFVAPFAQINYYDAPASGNAISQTGFSAESVRFADTAAPRVAGAKGTARINPLVQEPESGAGAIPVAMQNTASWHQVPGSNPVANALPMNGRITERSENGTLRHANHINTPSSGIETRNPEPAAHAAGRGTRNPGQKPVGYISSRLLRRIVPKKVVGAEALPE